MVRRYEFCEETYYVVRLADGRPLAVPEWMTRAEAAEPKIVTAPRLPVAVLVALRNEAITGLSSCEQMVQEESPHVSEKDQTPTATVRRSFPRTRRRSPASSAGAPPPGVDAMDAGRSSHDAQGGGR